MTYTWNDLDLIWSGIDAYQRQIILALCVILFLLFILVLIALIRGRRLRRRMDLLQRSVQELANAEQMRFLKELRSQQKTKPPE